MHADGLSGHCIVYCEVVIRRKLQKENCCPALSWAANIPCSGVPCDNHSHVLLACRRGKQSVCHTDVQPLASGPPTEHMARGTGSSASRASLFSREVLLLLGLMHLRCAVVS